jgi:leucyl-tRNA synthetase
MARELALTSPKVRPHVEGREIRKIIYVPGRLVNLVVG